MANSSYKISDQNESFWDETFDFKGSVKFTTIISLIFLMV